MNRKKFLETLGVGAAFALTSTCLGSCTREKTTPNTNLDITVDLTDEKYKDLETIGNYVIHEGIVISRTITGEYAAATHTCSHESLNQITYTNDNEWFCTAHGARFDLAGNGLNANGSDGLKIYQVELTGTQLRIFD